MSWQEYGYSGCGQDMTRPQDNWAYPTHGHSFGAAAAGWQQQQQQMRQSTQGHMSGYDNGQNFQEFGAQQQPQLQHMQGSQWSGMAESYHHGGSMAHEEQEAVWQHMRNMQRMQAGEGAWAGEDGYGGPAAGSSHFASGEQAVAAAQAAAAMAVLYAERLANGQGVPSLSGVPAAAASAPSPERTPEQPREQVSVKLAACSATTPAAAAAVVADGQAKGAAVVTADSTRLPAGWAQGGQPASEEEALDQAFQSALANFLGGGEDDEECEGPLESEAAPEDTSVAVKNGSEFKACGGPAAANGIVSSSEGEGGEVWHPFAQPSAPLQSRLTMKDLADGALRGYSFAESLKGVSLHFVQDRLPALLNLIKLYVMRLYASKTMPTVTALQSLLRQDKLDEEIVKAVLPIVARDTKIFQIWVPEDANVCILLLTEPLQNATLNAPSYEGPYSRDMLSALMEVLEMRLRSKVMTLAQSAVSPAVVAAGGVAGTIPCEGLLTNLMTAAVSGKATSLGAPGPCGAGSGAKLAPVANLLSLNALL